MMTLESFENSLDRDLGWRKKEFSNIELLILEKSENSSLLETLYRSAILLLYSHWEGHIKHCARQYIKYICSHNYRCSELQDNFHQIMLGKYISDKNISQLNAGNIHHQQELFYFFKNQQLHTFKVDEMHTISTQSNLNFERLSIILSQLGVEIGSLETKKAFIDEKLLDGRNSIAHGNRQGNIKPEKLYGEIKDELLAMIEYFHSLIRESIINQTYLKTTME